MPLALYALALALFVMGTSEFILAGLLPAIAMDLDVSIGTAGLLTSAFAGAMVIGAPLMAAVSHRWPPRFTLVVCLLLFAGCHIVGALTPDFSLLLATRALSALANAGFLAVALSRATTLVPADRKGRALSILLSGTTIATVVGVPAGTLIGTTLGWRAMFWLPAALCVPALIGVLRGITSAATGAGHAVSPGLRAEFSQLRRPRVVLAMSLGALVNGGTFAAFTFLAPVVTEVAGLSEGWISAALVMFGVGSFLGVATAGRLSDRHPGVVLGLGGPLLLVGWIASVLIAPFPVALIVLVFVQGFLSFGVGSTLIAQVLHAASGAPTMGGSYATAALNIGAAAGPVLGAFGLTTRAGLLAPFWVAAVLTGIALVFLLVAARTRKDETAAAR
ncbi:Cmx/CmrA family chloramphenicol efflux MFS transporter [Microbacterium arabinogalactanolyticum]|uniref:Cmx/CmrA family chloramphenicol efflux MFS transporter n=1 Tax=Microbacterium arabinogalactanolyticum TaxID=69365 RepID=UPI0025570B9C|nr:Cmx/CmrA family chloramphenicol efflux MFS transporter [Microbacterium arabinogalactanolyticum]GLC84973.1 chloramphenicol resistance protein [Microbacterium arabinogalactanolyticum]